MRKHNDSKIPLPLICRISLSIRSANLRVSSGPRCLLVSKYLDMATTQAPLENRVLLWTGLPNKAQRGALHTYISPLPLRHRRILLSFARAARTLWECCRQQLATASSPVAALGAASSVNFMQYSQNPSTPFLLDHRTLMVLCWMSLLLCWTPTAGYVFLKKATTARMTLRTSMPTGK